MSKKIVVSQPMYMPWIGMFEQLKLADIFVHYDDVQFPKGRSFINRVQIKTKDGIKWLTVPIDRNNSGTLINETLISYNDNWIDNHISIIKQAYSKSPHKNEVSGLIDKLYSKKAETISEFNINSFELISEYFDFKKEFVLSSDLNEEGKSSTKLINIVKQLDGNTYITGLGALKYIDYDLFERNHISVEYMNYVTNTYEQLFSKFTPYVTILDLIANVGIEGVKLINSKSIYWKDFIK